MVRFLGLFKGRCSHSLATRRINSQLLSRNLPPIAGVSCEVPRLSCLNVFRRFLVRAVRSCSYWNFEEQYEILLTLAPDCQEYRVLPEPHDSNATASEERGLFQWGKFYKPAAALKLSLALSRPSPFDFGPVGAAVPGPWRRHRTFQIDHTLNIVEALERYRPEWRIKQSDFMQTQIMSANPEHPFMFRLSCHMRVPGVILP